MIDYETIELREIVRKSEILWRQQRDQIATLTAQRDRLAEAIRKMDCAMDMQEKREEEVFHISQPTAKLIWDEARKSGRDALASLEQPK